MPVDLQLSSITDFSQRQSTESYLVRQVIELKYTPR